MFKRLVDRIEALPADVQERLADDISTRLDRIEAGRDDTAKLAALRRDLSLGLDQLDRGEKVSAADVFAELKSGA